MKTLRLAPFGLRAEVGDSLTPEMAIDFACAFGTLMDGAPILVGRDTRGSSGAIRSAVVSGLMSTGCDVMDLGVCPTPILQYCVGPRGAGGAVSISGGHMRAGFNALTLIGPDGAFIEPVGGEAVLDIFHARDFRRPPWNGFGRLHQVEDCAGSYFTALASLLDSGSIRRSGFTVVMDSVNGAGCRFLAPFADALGVKLVAVNAEESAHMAHDPEPRPRNARQVSSLIKHVQGDIGFVSSSDMGRLAFVCEDGETASEEYTFALIADHVLSRRPGTIVTNCCTTRTVDDVAAAHGAQVVKTRVGQAYVMSAMADSGGVVGGEGNGSVAMPSFSRAFDAFLMMGLILDAMAATGRKPSALLGGLPRYHVVKKQVYGEPHRCYRALESLNDDAGLLAGGRRDLTDGLRLDWEDGWLHMRASQTEPMVRIISESCSKPKAADRASEAARILEQRL